MFSAHHPLFEYACMAEAASMRLVIVLNPSFIETDLFGVVPLCMG